MKGLEYLSLYSWNALHHFQYADIYTYILNVCVTHISNIYIYKYDCVFHIFCFDASYFASWPRILSVGKNLYFGSVCGMYLEDLERVCLKIYGCYTDLYASLQCLHVPRQNVDTIPGTISETNSSHLFKNGWKTMVSFWDQPCRPCKSPLSFSAAF